MLFRTMYSGDWYLTKIFEVDVSRYEDIVLSHCEFCTAVIVSLTYMCIFFLVAFVKLQGVGSFDAGVELGRSSSFIQTV